MKNRLGEGEDIAPSRLMKSLSHFFFDNASARGPPPSRCLAEEIYANGEHGGSQIETRGTNRRRA
jgi:hypothetical protein